MVVIRIPKKIQQNLPEDYVKLLRVTFAEAIESNHRRLLVLSNASPEHVAYTILSFAENFSEFSVPVRGLYVTEDFSGEFLKRYSDLNRILSQEKSDELILERDVYENSTSHMGKTYDFMILDMYKSLTPDDLGRLLGSVRGGGIIIFWIRDFDEFENIKTTFHEHLLTPPYTLDDVRNIFERRFKRKLLEYDGIIIYDFKKGKIKGEIYERSYNVNFPKRKSLKAPKNAVLPKEIYELALTEDQIEVLRLLENVLSAKKVAYVITADRGRGKSASIGLFIAGLSSIVLSSKKKTFDIGITAPRSSNVNTLFEFVERGLKELGLEYEKISKRKISIDRRIYIEYREPLSILSKKYDILVVDEAAGIGVNMLYEFLRKYKRIIFASTIHGYEGAGRSFSVKFMKYLKEKTKFKVIEYKMHEPIRYSSDDPVEKWLFDTLLLDAEPAKLYPTDEKFIEEKRTSFYHVPIEEWFEKDEEKLRQFVGIYVLAHYQNRPNDVAMLADAPHHDAFALELKSEKIVTGIQIAYEGGIPEETIKRMLKDYKPKGNIIPDLITKHYRRLDFAKLKGMRIVRIATHPEIQGRGLGSEALKDLFDYAKKKKFNWLGSSFGATEQLLNFWQKNGFVVVHISPEKNKVSGEYSVAVIKPLDKKTEKIVRQLNYEFRWKFLNSITDVFYDITPELALMLLRTPYEFEPHFEPFLTDLEVEKAKLFIRGPMTYEAAADIVRNLALYYFTYTKKDRPKLSEDEEKVLFSKIFLAWSFRKINDYYGFKLSKSLKALKGATKKIYKWLYG